MTRFAYWFDEWGTRQVYITRRDRDKVILDGVFSFGSQDFPFGYPFRNDPSDTALQNARFIELMTGRMPTSTDLQNFSESKGLIKWKGSSANLYKIQNIGGPARFYYEFGFLVSR